MKQTIKLTITDARFLMSELQQVQYTKEEGSIENLVIMEIFAEQYIKVQKGVFEKRKAVSITLKPSQLFVLGVFLLNPQFNHLDKLQFVRPIMELLHKAIEKQETLFTNSLQNAIG